MRHFIRFSFSSLAVLALAVMVACSSNTSPSSHTLYGGNPHQITIAQPFAGDSTPGDSLLVAVSFRDLYAPPGGPNHSGYDFRQMKVMWIGSCHVVQNDSASESVNHVLPGYNGDCDDPTRDTLALDSLHLSGHFGSFSQFADDSGVVTFVWVFGQDTGLQIAKVHLQLGDTLNPLGVGSYWAYQHVIAAH